jgi:hypothetical protein
VKFLNESDVKLFLIEIGSLDKLTENLNSAYVPTDEEFAKFLSRRKKHTEPIKDKEKSRESKDNWRKNRSNMMRGIKAYHRSTDGKRFHKRLGRFLASRITKNDENIVLEALKGLASAKTTLLTELEFYHPLTEQMELESFVVDYALPIFTSIENKIIRNEDLSEDEFSFLFDITETAEVVLALAHKANKQPQEVEAIWKEIKSSLMRSGHKESDENFYGLLVSILKKKLGIE